MMEAKKSEKTKELRAKSEKDLHQQVLDLKKESLNQRFQQANGQLKDTSQCRKTRRHIARIKTVLAEKAKKETK